MSFEAWRRSSLAGGCLGLLVALAWSLGAFGDWDRSWVGFLHRIRGPRRADGRILVVEVDRRSLRAQGTWPWSDEVWRRFFENCRRGGAKAVALEAAIFPPDMGRPGPGRKAMLAAMAALPALYLSVETPLGLRAGPGGLEAPGLVRPEADLRRVACDLGHGAFDVERPGLWGDHLPRAIRDGTRRYLPLAFLLARHGEPELQESALLGNVAWPGPLGSSIPSISASAVIAGDGAALAALKDRLVLVGGSAHGLFPSMASPFGHLSGVAVQASILHSLLKGRSLHSLGPIVVFPALLLLGLLTGSAGLGRGLVWAWGTAFFFVGGLFVLGLWTMVFTSVILPFVPMAAAVFLAAMAVTVDRWIDLRSSLHRARSLSKLALDHMPLAVFAFEADGRLGLANTEAGLLLRRLGFAESEGIDLARLRRGAVELFSLPEGDERFEREVELELGELGRRQLAMISLPLVVGRKAEGRVLLVEDQTERRALFERLAREDRLVALGRFAAGIVHEIKNPLQTMRNAFEVLGEGTSDPDEAELARTGRGEVDRLGELLREILSFARPDLGDVEEAVELGDVVEKVFAMTGPVLRKRSVELVYEEGSDLGAVRGRVQRLTQVLLNLVDNAAQAMDAGGRVVVRAEGRGEEIHLSVSDTGRGMSPDEMEGIFQPFVTTRPDGTGLGLFLVESYVLDMGGRISVESEKGQGSVVRLAFPRA